MDKFLKYKNYLKIKNKKNKKIQKKTAVITGGFGRIGSVFLYELLFLGYDVICLSRSRKNFEEFVENVPNNLKKKITWNFFDLLDLNSVSSVAANILSNVSKIDFLINCAMSSYRGKNFSYNEKNFLEEFNGIYGSTFLITEKLLPAIRKSKNGKIINVGSIWGSNSPKFESYLDMDIAPTANISSGKAALMQYTKFLVSREGSRSIKVNNLVPGWFPRKGKIERKDYIKKICQNIPLGRIGKLEDLIPAISFLLSPDNNYYNGQNLYVDGGYTVF